MTSYVKARCLDQAVSLLATGDFTVIGGGTDLMAVTAERMQPGGSLLDVSDLEPLRAIVSDDTDIRIGGAVTWREILCARLPPGLRGLEEAARSFGSHQVRNRATMGGNLCSASPVADSVPVLLSAQAKVELASRRGTRRIPLSDFLVGRRRTCLARDELLVAIVVPVRACSSGAFLKIGQRAAGVISIASASAVLSWSAKRRIRDARVAVGALSETATRLNDLETRLIGLPIDGMLGESVRDEDFAGFSPLHDHRSSAWYRVRAAAALTRRVLVAASMNSSCG